jgi:hypothetical protein
MRCLPILASLLLASAPSAVLAQSAAGGETLSLSPQEKADLLAGHSEESVDAARAGLDGGPARDGSIHGEMGVMIGTHGTRGAYGTAAVPLGDNAGAVVSFESSRYGYRR